jgi:hypothetical protein
MRDHRNIRISPVRAKKHNCSQENSGENALKKHLEWKWHWPGTGQLHCATFSKYQSLEHPWTFWHLRQVLQKVSQQALTKR